MSYNLNENEILDKLKSLIEVEINPLIVRAKGKGVIAADALIHYLEDIK